MFSLKLKFKCTSSRIVVLPGVDVERAHTVVHKDTICSNELKRTTLCREGWRIAHVVANVSVSTIRWRDGVVIRTSDSQSREIWFEFSCCRFETLAISLCPTLPYGWDWARDY